MHGVADLGRLQTGDCLSDPRTPLLTQPRDALGVVAVGAALVERESRVRKSAHAVQRRRRYGCELRQAIAAQRRRVRQRFEQRELPVFAC